tara:strand:- start:66 stop:1232 length:1167 start_codon:yes stop_codon:yes gene_type:complete
VAFSNVDPSKRDEFLAFASLVRSQTDIQQKLYSLETRSERSAYIKSLGFDPETLSSVINSVEFIFGDKRVTYAQWLQLKGVRNETPLPLNVIVSAMRKSGFNNAYDQLSKDIEQYINELSGYSGGAGTSVKKTTTTRSPKKDTEAVDTADDIKDVSDKGISEESQDFVASDKNSDTKEEGKALDFSSEKFESTDKDSDSRTGKETSDSSNEATDSKADQINDQVDKYSSEHSDLQSSYTSEQSAEISKEATNFKDSVNNLKEQYDKGEISKTDFISSLAAEANKSLDKAAEIAPQESKAYDELKDGIDEALKAAESENITKGTDEGDESGDKDSSSDKDSGSNDSSSDSIIKGLKDPDMWIGAIVGAVGIEAVKKGAKALANYYKDNS